MPEQLTDPQPTPDDICIPCKHQACLDDNGEPVGVPVPKRMKSGEKNGQKNKAPTKMRPQNQKTGPKTTSATVSTVAPAKKKKTSAELEPDLANNSGVKEGTNPLEAKLVGSSDDKVTKDDVEIEEKLE